jgi:hypothetical protein
MKKAKSEEEFAKEKLNDRLFQLRCKYGDALGKYLFEKEQAEKKVEETIKKNEKAKNLILQLQEKKRELHNLCVSLEKDIAEEFKDREEAENLLNEALRIKTQTELEAKQILKKVEREANEKANKMLDELFDGLKQLKVKIVAKENEVYAEFERLNDLLLAKIQEAVNDKNDFATVFYVTKNNPNVIRFLSLNEAGFNVFKAWVKRQAILSDKIIKLVREEKITPEGEKIG